MRVVFELTLASARFLRPVVFVAMIAGLGLDLAIAQSGNASGAPQPGAFLVIRAGDNCTVRVNGKGFDMKAGETRTVEAFIGVNLVQAVGAKDPRSSFYKVVRVKNAEHKSVAIRLESPISIARTKAPKPHIAKKSDIRKNQQLLQELLAEASQHRERGENAAAIAAYGKVLALDPDNAEANAGINAANKAEDLRLGCNCTYQAGQAGVKAPKPIYEPDPEYSEEARRAKFEGSVTLRVIVGADGHVKDARVQIPAGLGLDEKALEAAKRWVFEPATKDGKPVDFVVSIWVRFSLGRKTEQICPRSISQPDRPARPIGGNRANRGLVRITSG